MPVSRAKPERTLPYLRYQVCPHCGWWREPSLAARLLRAVLPHVRDGESDPAPCAGPLNIKPRTSGGGSTGYST